MRIIVTGATGNIGTAVLRRLVESGASHEIVALSRRKPPVVPPYDAVQWQPVDIGADDALTALTDAFAGADAIVHLAWLIQPSHDRELMRRVNQRGTVAVARAAVQAGVPHLLHMSSIGAYAPADRGQVVDETWPVTGIASSPYSVDKAAAEAELMQFEGDLTITRMRPTLVLQPDAASEIARYFLGPALPVRAVRPAMLRRAPWPSSLLLQFVHADDVASAVELVLERRADGAFNVAADPVVDRDVFRDLFDGVGPDVPVRALRPLATLSWLLRVQPTDPGWLDLGVQVPLIDTARLRALGWSPEHTGTATLRDFVAALRRGTGHPGPLLHPKRG